MINLQSCKMAKPKLVAVAKDNYLTPKVEFPDSPVLPSCIAPVFGNDINYGFKKLFHMVQA